MTSRTNTTRLHAGCAAIVVAMLQGSTAQADAPQPPPTSAADEEDDAEIAWKWRELTWADYVYTGAITVGAGVEIALPPLEQADVTQGGVLFDDAVREAMVLTSKSNRSGLATMSDIALVALISYPVIVDGAIVAWGVRKSPEVFWRMTMINLQAFALTSVLTGVTKRLVDRQRPVATACLQNPAWADNCVEQSTHDSFPSGHTSMSFAAAGLSCLHHAELELHGRAGDTLACAFMLTGATATGISRIAADRHYLTDVLTGAAVGTFSGVLVPWLMYYQFDLAPTDTSTVVPTASPNEVGAMWTGVF